MTKYRATLVAGGNRSAAYLMEWLGLPTLESSNNPDKEDDIEVEQSTPPGSQEHKESGEECVASVTKGDQSPSPEGVAPVSETSVSASGSVVVLASEGGVAETTEDATKVASETETNSNGEHFWQSHCSSRSGNASP